MREVEFYALRSTVEKLTAEVDQLKSIVSNNVKVTAQNEAVLSDNLESASLLAMALLDELCTVESLGITQAKIIARIQEMERQRITKEEETRPAPEKPEDPHEGAFIFKSA